jgi:hypothetical protein
MSMLLSDYLKEHTTEAHRIRAATDGRCENCSLVFSLEDMEVHVLGSRPETGDPSRDLQKYLLVLCPVCYRSFTSGVVTESLQRELVRYRPRLIRREMRRILGYRPPAYSPPGTFDPATVFQEMLDSCSSDFCLNGG